MNNFEMRKYIKKPSVIEAIRWTDKNPKERFQDLKKFIGEKTPIFLNDASMDLTISTADGDLIVSDGDWVIKGAQGEILSCKPGDFEKNYEEV